MNKTGYKRVSDVDPDEDVRVDIDELRVSRDALEHEYLQIMRDGGTKEDMEKAARRLKDVHLAYVRAAEAEEKRTEDASELRERLQRAERKFMEFDARVRHRRWRLPKEREFVHAARAEWLNIIHQHRQALKLD